MKDLLVRVAIGGMLMVCGLICVAMPAQVYSFILDLTVVYCLLNCVYLAYMYSKEKKSPYSGVYHTECNFRQKS
ncbi:hypothetical protein, partial [uncultured Dubosiella sp.]|uniref:hypothetical protein n=1 Tax=uncultured Dubosiella sp. TaxID=1937011 RepID=UPI00272F3849